MTCPSPITHSMYADGALPAAEAVRLERHAASCLTCRARIEALRNESAVLRSALRYAEDLAPIPRFVPPPRARDFAVLIASVVLIAGFSRAFWNTVAAAIPSEIGWLDPLKSSALFDRARTGKGRHLHVAMQDSIMHYSRSGFIAQARTGKAAPRRAAAPNPPSGIFPCKPEGPNDYVYLLTSRANPEHWPRLLKLIGREDLIGDPRFDTADARVEHEAEVNEVIEADLVKAESIAFPITLILLIIVFGSVVSALLPLGVGVVAIVGTFLVLDLLARVTEVSIFALNLTTALGLGLAIDYALFVVSRFREELASGHSTGEAVERRLEKLRVDPARDDAWTAQVRVVADEYGELLAALPDGVEPGPELTEIRWMIEELRVSLYAAPMRTRYPVSVKRIQRAIDELPR